MRTRLAFLIPNLLLWTGCCASSLAQQPKAQSQHVFGDPKVSQYAPTRDYHVQNYKIAVRIDMAKGQVFGDEVITLQPLRADLRTFYLDSSQLRIDSVTLENASGKVLSFKTDDSKLWVTLDRGYSLADSLQVGIVYHGSPEARPFPDSGLSFIRPDTSMPNRPLEVWSYGWPQNNHYWFPCWDYPNDKSTSETIITVPEPLSVVSNGELLKETHSHGQATFDWVEKVPHSVYLVSIAVGPWVKYSQQYKTKSVDYYTPPGTDKATALRSFGLTPDMMAFYSYIYGTDYPYEKYAQTADHNFGGGTENISATSLAQTTLHDARAEQDYPSLDLVSHELAHQWFGDLITEWSWDGAWLSEGFATFSAALYRQHHYGEDAFRYQIYHDQQIAAREDAERYRRPIVDRHYIKPWDILDRTTYEKGAAVLDMLRYVMNDGREAPPAPSEPFFRMLRDYLTAHRARNVDTQNLIDAIRSSTGQELSWFFDEWVFKGGFPEYEVKTSYDAARHVEELTVHQKQRLDAVTPLFDMPVHVVFHSSDGKRQEAVVRVRQKDETFSVPVTFAPLWIDFDPYDHIFKRLTIDETFDALVARAERDDSMMSRLWAAETLGRSKNENRTAAVKTLSIMLSHDSFYGVRIASAKALGDLGGNEAKHALLLSLKQPDSHVRTASVAALGRFAQDPIVYTALLDVLHGDDSYAAQAAAARDLGQLATPQAFSVLESAVSAKPSDYVMAGLLEGLSHFKNPRAKAILQQQSASGATDQIRATAARWLKAM
jgi:aminopeptidase N